MNIRSQGLALAFVVAVLCGSAPQTAQACHCNGHFEIVDPESVAYKLKSHTVYSGFKPDMPEDHFSAHATRRAGETDNACRRRARDAAHLCMSALWRDRWVTKGGTEEAPECWLTLPDKINHVIRPIAGVTDDLKRDLEKAACCGDSPWRDRHAFLGKVFKRTYGDRGCGPNLETVDNRFQADYVFDCKSVRARENCGTVKFSEPREEEGFDRMGMDLPGMPIADVTSARNCQARCVKDHRCRAWTWVKPGFQGPGANCWLKNGVPWAQKNECCASGTVK